jgi:hypothetical protein
MHGEETRLSTHPSLLIFGVCHSWDLPTTRPTIELRFKMLGKENKDKFGQIVNTSVVLIWTMNYL